VCRAAQQDARAALIADDVPRSLAWVSVGDKTGFWDRRRSRPMLSLAGEQQRSPA